MLKFVICDNFMILDIEGHPNRYKIFRPQKSIWGLKYGRSVWEICKYTALQVKDTNDLMHSWKFKNFNHGIICLSRLLHQDKTSFKYTGLNLKLKNYYQVSREDT